MAGTESTEPPEARPVANDQSLIRELVCKFAKRIFSRGEPDIYSGLICSDSKISPTNTHSA